MNEHFCRNPTLAKCEDETHTPMCFGHDLRLFKVAKVGAITKS
jgi:hypothetical protein